MKKNNQRNVYQFKILLKDVRPPVWRRIQVPENYTFWDLHVAIQDSMGWSDCHLHEFNTVNIKPSKIKRIGIPDNEDDCCDVLPGWEEKIKEWFSLDENKAMNYTYDFGDNWDHRVELEKIIPESKDIKYPVCIKGKRACPLEDCGGAYGYENMQEILKNPNHEEYDEMNEWVGGELDTEEFNLEDIEFDNPRKRLLMLDYFEEDKINRNIQERIEN
ncbi:MAG: plasmid pRiA4b ORF-3 family protein [Candidatus Falkowbacteria bacterium]